MGGATLRWNSMDSHLLEVVLPFIIVHPHLPPPLLPPHQLPVPSLFTLSSPEFVLSS